METALQPLEASAGHGIRVVLVSYTRDGERLVAASARLSLSRKPLESLLGLPEGEVEEWIRETLARGHFSPWEHSVYTWVAEGCTRVCTHQLVRHRIASYTQQSMRYTEGVLRGLALRAAEAAGMECPGRPGGTQEEARRAYRCYAGALRWASESLGDEEVVGLAWQAFLVPRRPGREVAAREAVLAASRYYQLLSLGWQREDARYVLPHMVRTRIIVTMNARELVQSFFPLRLCTRAQWEIRAVAWALRGLLLRVHPRLFRYAGPRCVLQENTQRREPVTPEDIAGGRVEPSIELCPERVPRRGIPACLLSAMRSTLPPRA